MRRISLQRAVGYAVEWSHSWTVQFFIAAGVYVFGSVMTFLVNPNKRLTHSQKIPAAAAETIGDRI
jgi:hypothetical protein